MFAFQKLSFAESQKQSVMPKIFVIVIAIAFQIIVSGKDGYGIALTFGSETKQQHASFSTFSQINTILSFEGSFFRKQRGKYRPVQTPGFQICPDWISTKLTLGKKPANQAYYAVSNRYSQYARILSPVIPPARQHSICFSNCYGTLHRLSPF